MYPHVPHWALNVGMKCSASVIVVPSGDGGDPFRCGVGLGVVADVGVELFACGFGVPAGTLEP